MALYTLYVKTHNKLETVPFEMLDKKGNLVVSDRVGLEEIDLVTTQYKNENDLLVALQDMGYISKGSDRKVFVGHTRKGEIITKDVVYNNPFLMKRALYVIKQKEAGKKEKDIHLIKDNSFNRKIVDIKSYMSDSKYHEKMINNKSLPFHFNGMIKPYHDLRQQSYLSVQDSQDLQYYDDSISWIFSNYKHMRGFLVWQEQVEKNLYYDLQQKRNIPPIALRKQGIKTFTKIDMAELEDTTQDLVTLYDDGYGFEETERYVDTPKYKEKTFAHRS